MEYITLDNGVRMPQEGYGVFQIPPEECERCVGDALSAGYRLIDTASAYGNEEGVGAAVRKSGIPREELFITTKLWVQDTSYEGAKKAAAASMKRLGHGDKALLEEPVFGTLAEKYGKSNAQIILRWHVQSGHVVIPGSKNPDHIRDNFDIFDFALTEEEMGEIAKVNKGVRYYTATPEMIAAYASMELKEDL